MLSETRVNLPKNKQMKKIFLMLMVAITVFFASCSSTHKLQTSSHEKVDSIAAVKIDTTTVNKTTTETSGLNATGVDIEFDYGTDSTYNAGAVDSSDTTKDPFVNIIKDAVAASGKTGRLPQKVKIHFDTLKDTTSKVATSDSTHGTTVSNITLKKTVDSTSKTIVKKGIAGSFSWGLILLIAGGLVAVGVYLVKKFKLV